jgi:hypothetical protein
MTLPLSPLQLGLIVAGVALVVGVMIYNWWLERRVRRRIDTTFRKPVEAVAMAGGGVDRVEPTLRGAGEVPDDVTPAYRPAEATSSFVPPMDVIPHDEPPEEAAVSVPVPDQTTIIESEGATGRAPDPEIECIVTLQPAKPVGVGAFAAGLHARLGKRLRWFGRTAPDGPWQLLATDSRGEFIELAACLLLADRNGAASRAQLDTFLRVMSELAPHLPAAMSVRDVASEADRAEALDRLCAEVDVQVGMTILVKENGSVAGTRLRGVAEASGFTLASGGKFEYAQEDGGAVLYTLTNLRNEPFTPDSLRLSATNGIVLVLDVPRVTDPPRTFDQMKLTAKRLAHNLGAELVDDNKRPLDDAALASIRKQVEGASEALRESGIEPGSPRALALFGA